jgi:hypothetical protein
MCKVIIYGAKGLALEDTAVDEDAQAPFFVEHTHTARTSASKFWLCLHNE